MTSLHRSEVTLRSVYSCCFAAFLAVAVLIGCGKSHQVVDDPQLKPIQAMLDSALPNGSTEAAVNQFLSTRGYPTDSHRPPGTVVGIIRHIDTQGQKLEPVTARVTFYFDANGKLNTTEIVRTFNRPIPQQESQADQPPQDQQSDQQTQQPQQQQSPQQQ